jgi:phosphatidate cytidylyltransferase
MLRQRLAVAAVGLPLLGLLLLAPEGVFSAAVEIVLAAAAYEFFRAAVPGTGIVAPAPLGAGAAAALFVSVVRVEHHAQTSLSWMLVVLALLLALALRPSGERASLGESTPSWWLVAVLYPAVLGSSFVLIRGFPDGQSWLLVLLAADFATDTGAYTIGRLFGRHLMAPAISPHKTWEGAAGGVAFGALAAGALPPLLGISTSFPGPVLIALGLPAAALVGDLLESALKRRIDVKDMSHLLPGHGGLLDRLDSLLLAGPLLYWVLRWLQT